MEIFKKQTEPKKTKQILLILVWFSFFLATGRSFHFFANIYHQKRIQLTNATCFYHETPVSKNFRVLNSILKRYGHPDISITNMKEIGMKLFRLLQSKIVSLWNRGQCSVCHTTNSNDKYAKKWNFAPIFFQDMWDKLCQYDREKYDDSKRIFVDIFLHETLASCLLM